MVSGALKLAPFAVVLVLSSASVFVPPAWTIATLLAAAVLFVVMAIRLDPAELVVVSTPLTFYADFNNGRLNLSVSDVFLVLLVAVLVLNPSHRANAHRVRAFNIFVWCSVAFLLAAMSVGVILASGAGELISWQAYFSDAAKLLVVFLYFSVAVMVFSDKLSHGDHRFLALWTNTAVVVAGLGIAGSLLYQRGVDLDLTLSFRAKGTFEDPNAFAAYLIASVGVAMIWSLMNRRRLIPWQVVPMIAGIALSYSRAAIVTCGAVLLVGFLVSLGVKQLRSLRWIACAMAAAAGIGFLLGGFSRLGEAQRELNFEGDIRFQLWTAAIRVWSEHPVFGVGLGQFRSATASLVDSPSSLLAHNTYLSFLAEGGIVGALLFLAIPGAVVVLLSREGGAVSRLFLLTVTAFLGMAATLNLQNFRPMWILLGIAVAWYTNQRAEADSTAKSLGDRHFMDATLGPINENPPPFR